MALERQTIEKKDFPVGRRGYDPDAVDAHLARIADEVGELRRSARRRSDTLATSASAQVQAIVEAAENSAAQIQRQAEDEAAEIRDEASVEARRTREEASGQAREYVGRVSESTAEMLQRLEAMESELGALTESLRTGANRLNADLQLLEGNLAEVTEAAAPRARFEAEPDTGSSVRGSQPVPSPTLARESAPAPAEPVAGAGQPEAAGAANSGLAQPAEERHDSEEDDLWGPEDEARSIVASDEDLLDSDPPALAIGDGGAAAGDDSEGARLIALNMALNGTSREETERYLADNFDLADRAGLLDEVYASVSEVG